MVSEHAKRATRDFVLADRIGSKLKELSVSLSIPYIVFGVNNSKTVDAVLRGITVLLNCAVPFIRTTTPLIGACIRNGIHYLDIAAELDSYRLAAERDLANVILLAGYVVEHVKDPVRLDIALHVVGSMSGGSAISAAENLTTTKYL